jgi:hypothetical protein
MKALLWAQESASNWTRTADLVQHGAPINGESLAHVIGQRLEVICELGELDLQQTDEGAGANQHIISKLGHGLGPWFCMVLAGP